MKTAHFFSGKRDGKKIAFVVIGINGATHGDNRLAEITVTDKREARRIAADHGAKPWNF